MKLIISISVFFLSTSVFAADCKFFKENYFGNYKVTNYDCTSNIESEYFECYSKNDNYLKISDVQISYVPTGRGYSLSVRNLDAKSNLIDELFFSEFDLQSNETFECSETVENGVKVQVMKQEIAGNGESRIYTMLTKKNDIVELEKFFSIAGETSKQVLKMKIK